MVNWVSRCIEADCVRDFLHGAWPWGPTHVSRDKKENGFHGITCLAWRIAVGAASQIHRDSNHGAPGTFGGYASVAKLKGARLSRKYLFSGAQRRGYRVADSP